MAARRCHKHAKMAALTPPARPCCVTAPPPAPPPARREGSRDGNKEPSSAFSHTCLHRARPACVVRLEQRETRRVRRHSRFVGDRSGVLWGRTAPAPSTSE